MIEIKKLSGILNKDDKEENILPNQHIDALNLRFYGGSNGLTAENIVGNTLVTNIYLPAGTNECIGGYYDGKHQRIIWGNWNSNARHGIYMYNISSGVVTPLLVCFTNSQTDILGFDLDYPMADPKIIYTTDIDGDIFIWITRNKRPKGINILQAVNNTYGANWLEEYLDIAKQPPTIPIKCAYENDATVSVNNLRKKIFRFKYRFWYRDNEKSTWSAISEIPVPFYYTDPQSDTDPTKNCRIGCVIQTGDESVVKVEIAAQESLGNVFSNFFSVIILDKLVLSISDNDVYVWRFYNSEAYVFVDLDESILDFDRVPDRANAQELLNGNVIIYGGITEGLDPIVPDVVMATSTEYPLAIDCNNILSVTQYGVEGFVSGENIHIIILGTIRRGQTFVLSALVGATTFTVTYTAIVGDTPATVLAGLSASATGQGFTQVSITDNELIISRASQILLRSNITTTDQSINGTFVITHSTKVVRINGGASFLPLFTKGIQFFLYANLLNVDPFTVVSSAVAGADLDITVELTLANETITTTLFFVNPLNNSIPAYNSSSKENWGIVYFDEKYKTNGVTTSPDFNVTTQYLGLNKNLGTLLFYTPYVTASILHRPPLWAKSYQWVRTANLTKQTSLNWVSDRTYKDDKYAYISIESINAYRRVNPSSVISYKFLPGDRISFYVLYDTDGQPLVAYTAAYPHDYEIYDEVINPDINGAVRTGQFLKIILPTLNGPGGVFNFSDGLSLDYNNYYIELYTPAKSATEGLDVYYEFSEEYGIGNPGTITAFHQGQLQNQSTDLVTPATFKFNKGDAWYRTRKIGVGNTLLYDVKSDFYEQLSGAAPYYEYVVGQKLVLQAYSTADYTIVSDINKDIWYKNFNQPAWTISVINNDYTFNVKGVININVVTGGVGSSVQYDLYILDTASISTRYSLGVINDVVDGQLVTFNIDELITIPQATRAFLVLSTLNCSCNLVSGYLSYSEPTKDFQIGVIDENFSDFYESKVNSNGRTQTVHPDEKTNSFGTLMRWGSPYLQNTNINQINRFYPNNFNEVDRSNGDIQRFKTRGSILRIFQNMAVGQMGIYGNFIQNKDGDSQLVIVKEILTKNNIKYYSGEHGIGTQYTSLVSSTISDYFPDVVTGDLIRLSNDGFTPIGYLYKGQFYIRSLIIPYNKTYLRSNGATAKILGCFDNFDGQYIPILQGGENNGDIIDSYAFSFNERRNGFCSFYDFKNAEFALSAEDIIVTWLNGNMYLHNNTTNYCNFYGQQYGCYITVVFNISLFEKKSWMSISELASAIWACPIIYTNVKSYGSQRQETILLESDFATLEDMFHAAFLRDIHSIGGIVNGDEIKGNYLVCQFKKDSASNLITLSEIQVMFKDSPLTNR